MNKKKTLIIAVAIIIILIILAIFYITSISKKKAQEVITPTPQEIDFQRRLGEIGRLIGEANVPPYTPEEEAEHLKVMGEAFRGSGVPALSENEVQSHLDELSKLFQQ